MPAPKTGERLNLPFPPPPEDRPEIEMDEEALARTLIGAFLVCRRRRSAARLAAVNIRITHFVLLFSHVYKPDFSCHFAERAREQAGSVKIDRFYPEGVQSHHPVAKVAVTFNQPMVSVGTLDDLESQV